MDDSTSNPWAPPTVDTPSTPPMPAPESVVLIEPTVHRRPWVLLLTALVVLGGLGVGAFLVLRGDDKPTFALDRAAAAAGTTKWTEMQITMESQGQSITMNSKGDTDKGLARMSMDLGAIVGSSSPIDMIIDTKNDTMYMGGAFLTALGAKVDTPWVKIDRATLEKAGQDASAFDQLDVGNQLAPATLFASAVSVRHLGRETIDGEQLQHDEVTVDTAKLVAVNPFLKRTMDKAGATLPTTITYQVFITKDNEIRRLTYEVTAGTDKVKLTVVSHALTAAPGIEVPAEADVTDLADLR